MDAGCEREDTGIREAGRQDGSQARGDSRRETESRRECEKETDGMDEEGVKDQEGDGGRGDDAVEREGER